MSVTPFGYEPPRSDEEKQADAFFASLYQPVAKSSAGLRAEAILRESVDRIGLVGLIEMMDAQHEYQAVADLMEATFGDDTVPRLMREVVWDIRQRHSSLILTPLMVDVTLRIALRSEDDLREVLDAPAHTNDWFGGVVGMVTYLWATGRADATNPDPLRKAMRQAEALVDVFASATEAAGIWQKPLLVPGGHQSLREMYFKMVDTVEKLPDIRDIFVRAMADVGLTPSEEMNAVVEASVALLPAAISGNLPKRVLEVLRKTISEAYSPDMLALAQRFIAALNTYDVGSALGRLKGEMDLLAVAGTLGVWPIMKVDANVPQGIRETWANQLASWLTALKDLQYDIWRAETKQEVNAGWVDMIDAARERILG